WIAEVIRNKKISCPSQKDQRADVRGSSKDLQGPSSL
uniref:Uncharacterized protein n=1 Tax=Amphimedon queenslandica TaxID=400682 RepID=A0A1X7TGM2_AMPQE